LSSSIRSALQGPSIGSPPRPNRCPRFFTLPNALRVFLRYDQHLFAELSRLIFSLLTEEFAPTLLCWKTQVLQSTITKRVLPSLSIAPLPHCPRASSPTYHPTARCATPPTSIPLSGIPPRSGMLATSLPLPLISGCIPPAATRSGHGELKWSATPLGRQPFRHRRRETGPVSWQSPTRSTRVRCRKSCLTR